jgi:hypothetical protein
MGRLVGLITLENIAEFVMVYSALESARDGAGRPTEPESQSIKPAGTPSAASDWRRRGAQH